MNKHKICSIDGCVGKAITRGWCSAHYHRFQRYGDPIAGQTYQGEPMRWINNIAVHFSGNDCLHWPYAKMPNGYGSVNYKGKTSHAHRVICELVHGAPETNDLHAAHSCGKGHEGCVNPCHIRWATPSENQKDRVVHKTHCRGERNKMSKLTGADVINIRKMYSSGNFTQSQIGALYSMSQVGISLIIRNKNWSWLK